ncbi:MAG: hypothetical protein H6832_03430 [Planctomycetes bacterium]|nr:hypothetical protein [Planctomycetota bacterium]
MARSRCAFRRSARDMAVTLRASTTRAGATRSSWAVRLRRTSKPTCSSATGVGRSRWRTIRTPMAPSVAARPANSGFVSASVRRPTCSFV